MIATAPTIPAAITPIWDGDVPDGLLGPMGLAFIARIGAFRANGAYIAPWAGLAAPWIVVP